MKGGNINDATKEMLAPESEQSIMPGLRFGGRYGGGNFGLLFHRESVTMLCGEAEQALPYAIQHSATNTTLVIASKPTPLSLEVMPDGSIHGSGPVQVNGRIITGTTEDTSNPFTFAPNVARCEVGTLTSGGSITAPPAAPATTSAAPATAAPNAPAPTAGSASLRISTSPGVAKLLAGKTLAVLRDDLENVLASAGINPEAGSSRIALWTRACGRGATDPVCRQGLTGFAKYSVARTGFDASGVATFPNVPPSGTFYLVADTAFSNHLLWNVRIDLKPGANAITFDERNTTPIR